MTMQESSGARAEPRDESDPDPGQLIPVVVHASGDLVAGAVARDIADAVRADPRAVLGLATGGTMVDLYAELVRLSSREGLDLSAVTTFNLDEYLGLGPRDPRSFRCFMDEHLFGPAGFEPARTHFPDAARAVTDPLGAARAYEDAIAAAGGIELQLLGLGRNGHIAFNEPGSSSASRTRVIELDETTRKDAVGAFGSFEEVPCKAITVGVATILEARRLRILALGEHKAEIVARTVEGEIGPSVPSTLLRGHPDATLHLDSAAASRLADR